MLGAGWSVARRVGNGARLDVGANHLAAVVDVVDDRELGTGRVDRPRAAVPLAQEAVQEGTVRIEIAAHRLAAVVQAGVRRGGGSGHVLERPEPSVTQQHVGGACGGRGSAAIRRHAETAAEARAEALDQRLGCRAASATDAEAARAAIATSAATAASMRRSESPLRRRVMLDPRSVKPLISNPEGGRPVS